MKSTDFQIIKLITDWFRDEITYDEITYPNIHIITKRDNIWFCDTSNIGHRTQHYSHFKKFFNLNNHSAIVIISQIINTSIKQTVDYLKNKNIDNIYFFIDDVFRLNLSRSLKSKSYEEIIIIKKIINELNLKSYKIFHCEITNNYNYSDLYLYTWLLNNADRQKQISYKFTYWLSCLNNRPDFHRQMIGLLLCQKQNVFLTLNDHLNYNFFLNNALFNIDNFNKDIQKSMQLGIKYFKNRNNLLNHIDSKNIKLGMVDSIRQNDKSVYDNIKNSFINIVTETTFISDYVYFSEKVFKPIICYRPFILLAPAGSIKKLKEFGFKTFDEWWDESYDQEENHVLRFQKAYYEIENILKKSKYDLDKMLLDMTDTLIHNKNHIKNFKHNLLPII